MPRSDKEEEEEEEDEDEGKKWRPFYQELEDISPWELGDTTIATMPTYLLDAIFVRQGFPEHAQQGFPLVPIQGVSNKHDPLPSHQFQQTPAMEPRQVQAFPPTALGDPPPAQVAMVWPAIALAAEAFVKEGAGAWPIVMVI
mgnify:FL=1